MNTYTQIEVLWKERLNTYGQQFHQYINKTSNDLSPQFIEHKKDHDMTVKIQVLDWDRHKMWQW